MRGSAATFWGELLMYEKKRLISSTVRILGQLSLLIFVGKVLTAESPNKRLSLFQEVANNEYFGLTPKIQPCS